MHVLVAVTFRLISFAMAALDCSFGLEFLRKFIWGTSDLKHCELRMSQKTWIHCIDTNISDKPLVKSKSWNLMSCD